MKKLDHVILLAAIEAVSKLSGIKIDAKSTIESFEFKAQKLPTDIKTAAQFNEYVEGRVIPSFYNNVIGRFHSISKRYIDNNIRTREISNEEYSAIRELFDEKIKKIAADMVDATSADIRYYNCSIEWLESPEEQLSCSYYLFSSFASCVESIFNDIYDIIRATKCIEKIEQEEPVHNEDAKPEQKEEKASGVRNLWDVKGKSNPVYFGISEIVAESKPVNKEAKAEESKDETHSENKTMFGRVNPMFPGFITGTFNKKDVKKDEKPAEKPEQDAKKDVKKDAKKDEKPADNKQNKSDEKKDPVKDNKPAQQQNDKKQTGAVTPSVDQKKDQDNKDAEESKAPEEKKPEDSLIQYGEGVPEIKILPTSQEIKDMLSTPQSMVNLDAPIINPQYPDIEMIMKHFIIGKHVNISELDYEFFRDSLLTAADWIEDYDKDLGHKTPTTFAFYEFRDVNNYTLVRTLKTAGRHNFLNPDDKKYIVIKVENDTYDWFVKDESNNLVHANIA